MIGEHVTEFAGLPAKSYDPDEGLDEPAASAWRVELEEIYDAKEPLAEILSHLVAEPRAPEIRALIVGAWEGCSSGTPSANVVQALVTARARLTSLRALFLGDLTSEESEISWIVQSDLGPLLDAYPELRHLRVRGGQGLRFGVAGHPLLESLVVEAGGLGAEVVQQVAHLYLPSLTHLELWLGAENYGGDWRPEDLAPILDGRRLPRLTHLGLRDSERADEVAAWVTRSAVLPRLRTLDLSLGNLGDEGAAALLASPLVAKLEELDLHHHYVSDEHAARLRALGPKVDLSDKREPDHYGGEEYRYIAVSE